MKKKSSPKLIANDVFGKPYTATADTFKFRPSVYGIIIKGGKILLVPCIDGYDFPGGGMDINETIEQTLVREVWEETGLTVKQGNLLACEQTFFYIRHNKQPYNAILLYYSCKNISGTLSDANFMEDEKKHFRLAEWVPLSKIPKLKFYNGLGTTGSVALIKRILKK